MQIGRIIPLFIELRYRTHDRNIEELLLDRLSLWDFPKELAILEAILNTEKACILCDAFDEIDDAFHSEAIRELELLAEKYPKIRIIVTSRPGAAIQKSAFFRTVRLAPLEHSDLPEIIDKLDSSSEHAVNLIKEINSMPHEIRAVVNTPLMATLLLLAYKATNHLPSSINEFYDSLFHTVLSRHDGTKPGFHRKRKTELNDQQFRRAFESFCYFTRIKKLSALSEAESYDVSQQAFAYLRLTTDSESFIHDLKKITGLLLEEANKYYFIHKSVQEYFCACFLSRLADIKIKDFYTYCTKEGKLNWDVELSFLRYLDKNRYDKYFLLPLYKEITDYIWTDKSAYLGADSVSHVQRFLDSIEIYKKDYHDKNNNGADCYMILPQAIGWSFSYFELDHDIANLIHELYPDIQTFFKGQPQELLLLDQIAHIKKMNRIGLKLDNYTLNHSSGKQLLRKLDGLYIGCNKLIDEIQFYDNKEASLKFHE